MEKSPSDWIYYIAAKTTTSFMKRNERENKKNKENAVRLIVHGIAHRGEMWRGGGGREVKGQWGGGGGSFVSTYKRDGWNARLGKVSLDSVRAL
jgi:hypothetical protein